MHAGSGRVYGYARVSSNTQNLNRQIDGLVAFGVDRNRVICDKASGKSIRREGYLRLKARLHSGDTLVLPSLDRLGRNYDEVVEEWRELTKDIGVQIVVLDMPLLETCEGTNSLTGRFLADVVLQLLSYIAQIERESIHQRQLEGIAAAKARGVVFGRPRIKKPKSWTKVRTAYESGGLTRIEAARMLGVSASTFDAWRKAEPWPGAHIEIARMN